MSIRVLVNSQGQLVVLGCTSQKKGHIRLLTPPLHSLFIVLKSSGIKIFTTHYTVLPPTDKISSLITIRRIICQSGSTYTTVLPDHGLRADMPLLFMFSVEIVPKKYLSSINIEHLKSYYVITLSCTKISASDAARTKI
jgi:hypothetical protein